VCDWQPIINFTVHAKDMSFLKTKSTEPLSYRIGWLAALFAAHSDYESFSLADDGILLANVKSAQNRIPYLAIGSGITIERGYFWDVLAIHLENGEMLSFGGVAKKQSGWLQTALNDHCHNYNKAFYQRLSG
jgi:DNA helicase-4